MDGDVTRVVIVDDHLMFAESLARLLGDERDIAVAGIASNGAQARSLIAEEPPHVALVDYHLPDVDGVSLARDMLGARPDLGVIILTGSDDDLLMLAAIQAGCSGFLTKDKAATEVADAVRAVAAGEALISAPVLARLLARVDRGPRPPGSDLTARERDLLEEMARGLTNRAIAETLHLSVNTVRNYTQSILSKFGAHSKLEAVSLAVRYGLINYPKD